MSFAHIKVSQREGVGTLTLARPDRHNSLDVQTARDLRKAGLGLCRDPKVRVVLLCGEGKVFCSGADLKYIRDGGRAEDLDYLHSRETPKGYGVVFQQILEYIHSTISEIRRAPKPVIAVVDGAAAAGGLGLVLACDLVLASERAWFEWAYFKTALTGAESSTFMLPHLVGFHRAMEIALLSPRMSAQEAKTYGLVNRVYPDAELEPQSRALARRLAAGPTASYATAKQLLSRAAGMDRLDVHLDQELTHLSRIADTPDFAEGLTAFFERREAHFGEP